ncbi:MAG: hypothetical protein KA116_00240 [Proteobacteria bacterium]|nr:hypothetical protein [Pseudomonadota bacterium]
MKNHILLTAFILPLIAFGKDSLLIDSFQDTHKPDSKVVKYVMQFEQIACYKLRNSSAELLANTKGVLNEAFCQSRIANGKLSDLMIQKNTEQLVQKVADLSEYEYNTYLTYLSLIFTNAPVNLLPENPILVWESVDALLTKLKDIGINEYAQEKFDRKHKVRKGVGTILLWTLGTTGGSIVFKTLGNVARGQVASPTSRFQIAMYNVAGRIRAAAQRIPYEEKTVQLYLNSSPILTSVKVPADFGNPAAFKGAFKALKIFSFWPDFPSTKMQYALTALTGAGIGTYQFVNWLGSEDRFEVREPALKFLDDAQHAVKNQTCNDLVSKYDEFRALLQMIQIGELNTYLTEAVKEEAEKEAEKAAKLDPKAPKTEPKKEVTLDEKKAALNKLAIEILGWNNPQKIQLETAKLDYLQQHDQGSNDKRSSLRAEIPFIKETLRHLQSSATKLMEALAQINLDDPTKMAPKLDNIKEPDWSKEENPCGQ